MPKNGKHRIAFDLDRDQMKQVKIAAIVHDLSLQDYCVRQVLHGTGKYKIVPVDDAQEADIEADTEEHLAPPPKRRGRPPKQPAKPKPPIEPVAMVSEPSYTMGAPGEDGWSGDMEVPDDDPEDLDFNDNSTW